MLDRLLPRTADRTWNGPRAALWLFGLLLLLKAAMGTNVMLNAESVAMNADGIPVDSYPPDAARAVVALFSIWGIGHLMLALVGVVILVRYRSLVPLMLFVLLVEHVGRRIILLALPIARTGAPPGGAINAALLAVTVIALLLALWRPARTATT